MRKSLRVIGSLVGVLVCSATLSSASCVGDVDGDGRITVDDVSAAIPVLFRDQETSSAQAIRTDGNGDGVASVADLIQLLQLQPRVCPSPTPSRPPTTVPTATPTRTPTVNGTATRSPTATVPLPTATITNTPTVTRTPTITRTPTVTPTATATATPTQVCVVQSAQFGVTNGTLSGADCQRDFSASLRYTDVYTIAGTPGQSISVGLMATDPTPTIAPFIEVLDANEQFDSVAGAPPIQFVVTTTQPYTIMVTTDPATVPQLGAYQLTLTSVPCPTPVALTFNRTINASLSGSECPDPAVPAVGGNTSPVDIYTFTVPAVPMTVGIVMRQQSVDDDLFVSFSLAGPDGTELVPQFYDFDCAPFADLSCAQVRFLALQAGTYTITAGGGTGAYSLQLSAPNCATTPLANIPTDHALTCPGQQGAGCAGTLSSSSACAAPLPIPGISATTPVDPSSPADLYSFTANVGDVISVSMSSDGDAHLYLLGPAPTNALVAQDDDSGEGAGDAQLAATLPQAGTYTIVAANNNALQPDDAPLNYVLLVQKCPVRAALNPNIGLALTDAFSPADCQGFGGFPFHTYGFSGKKGQFVTATMTSTDVDAFVRIFGPDGSVVENDDDLLGPPTSDARASRILPVAGFYVVEVSTSPFAGTIDLTPPLPGFTVQAQTCPTTAVTPGAISGAFDDADCALADGTKFDVFTYTPGTTPLAASIVPPSSGCVLALSAEGPQLPSTVCSTDMLDLPIVSAGAYGILLAANSADTRGPYNLQLASCPLTPLGFGAVANGTLTAADCQAANGAPADWFLLRAGANLLRFNGGFGGQVDATFPLGGVLTDTAGAAAFTQSFAEPSDTMYPLGTDLAALLRIAGQAPQDQGSYAVRVNAASFRQ